MKVIECVPNFSEGRDQSVLDALARAISAVDGAMLLDVDPGRETNRTVFTFVGTPEAVAREKKSFTGQFLAPLLKRKAGKRAA